MIGIISFAGYLLLLTHTLNVLKRNRGKIRDRFNISGYHKRLTIGGALAALAALLHAAPVLLPGLGLALSPLSTLPVLIGTVVFADQVLAVFLATTGLLFFINAKEALIFLFATGPLGLSAALATISGKSIWRSLFVTASLLVFGIFLLIFMLGLPGLQNIIGALNPVNFALIVPFSVAYSFLFTTIARFLQKRLTALSRKNQLDGRGNGSPRYPRK